MLVRDAMTTTVVTADRDTPLPRLIDDMITFGVSALPVVDDQRKVVGIVSEADLVARRGFDARPRRVLSVVDDMLHAHHNRWRLKAEASTTADIMTTPVRCVGPLDSVRTATARMVTMGLKRLPVVDSDDRLVGIISQRDVLRLLHRTDHEIQLAVEAILATEVYDRDAGGLTAATADGVVTLHGSVPTAGDVGLLERLARDVPGVVDVRNHVIARTT
jgi:CBS domain-containing protein